MGSVEHNNSERDGNGADADRLVKSVIKSHYDQFLSDRFEKKLKAKYNVTRKRRRTSLVKYVLLAFLACILLTTVFFLLTNKNTAHDELDDAVFAHLSSPHTSSGFLTRGSQELSINDGHRREAALAFADRDYISCIHFLLQIDPDETLSEEDLFYLGLCYLYRKPAQYREAVQVLERALDGSVLYTEEIQWYVLLAYLANKEEDRAEKFARNIIINNSEHYRESEIKELIQLL